MEQNADEKIPTIEIVKDGPFKISNVENFYNSRGEKMRALPQMWFCRCGISENKPFCDGKHKDSDFSGEKEDDRVQYRWKNYYGKKIVVHDNRALCSHSGLCLKNLPKVFRKDERPWVYPDNEEDVDKVIETVKACPSGALKYSIEDTEYSEYEYEPAVHIFKHGPLNVTGGIRLIDPDGNRPEVPSHYSLCRCGVSKNKPFCDGTHLKIKFRDEKN